MTTDLDLYGKGTSSQPLLTFEDIGHIIFTERSLLQRTTPSAAPQYPLDPNWAQHLPDVEDAILVAMNADRVANGYTPLVRDPVLDQIELWKVMQEAWNQYMDHPDHAPPVERSFGARFVDYGYETNPTSVAIGENLAYGNYSTLKLTLAQGVEAAWMSDSGHRDNILNDSWHGVGIGAAMTTANHAPGLSPFPGLPFMGQAFGSKVIVPTPPPPPNITYPGVGSHWHKPTSKVILQVDSQINAKRVALHRVKDGAKTSALLATFYTTYVQAR